MLSFSRIFSLIYIVSALHRSWCSQNPKTSLIQNAVSSSISTCNNYKNCSACTASMECAWCPRSHLSMRPQCIEYRNAGFCSDFVYTNSKVAVYQNTCPKEIVRVRWTLFGVLFWLLLYILLPSSICCCCACFGCLEWVRQLWNMCCPGSPLPQYHGYMSLNDRRFRFPYGGTTTRTTRISTGAVLGRDIYTDYGSTTSATDGRISPRAQPHFVPGGEVATATAVPLAEVELGPMRSPEKDVAPSAPPMR